MAGDHGLWLSVFGGKDLVKGGRSVVELTFIVLLIVQITWPMEHSEWAIVLYMLANYKNL